MKVLLQKVTQPPLRDCLIERPRLSHRVLTNLDRKLSLLSAPLGYGKTSLAVEIASYSECPNCWYQLDEGDRDVKVFFAHLCISLKALPGIERFLNSVSADYTPWEITCSIAAALEHFSDAMLLIIDNYHIVDEIVEINQFVQALLTYLPSACHLILCSRNRTQLNLARLVVQQEINLISQKDLAFTSEEAEMLAAKLGCNQDVIPILEETRGWPVALNVDLHHRVGALPGDPHTVIQDYLIEECRESLPSFMGSDEMTVDKENPIPHEQYPKLEIQTLGCIRFKLNGKSLNDSVWNGRKPKDLVLFLAAHPEGVTRDQIVESLWDEAELKVPEQQCSIALSRARRALGGRRMIVREGNIYYLNRELIVAEDALELLCTAMDTSSEQITRILSCYLGEYLPGYYNDWVLDRRRAIEDHVLQLIEKLIDSRGQKADPRLVQYAWLALKLDNSHVTSHLYLIQLYLSQGRSLTALKQYRDYCCSMDELGGVPELDIVRMFAQGLAHHYSPPNLELVRKTGHLKSR